MAHIKEFKDYYKILHLSESASQEEIKKSFRKLALELHPDHNPNDPESENKFKEITEAYGVLSDTQKKQEYDRFRSDYLSGRSSSRFHYSQEDIFSSMFQGQNAQEIFEELNREFSRSGYRSGNSFFQTLFFGGAVGGLGRILRMVPGPIGRIGMGLKLAQVVGTSLYTLHKMKKAKEASQPGKDQKQENPIVSNLKGIFGKSAAEEKSPLDMDFSITIPAGEALNGTRKKISYTVDGMNEQLMVRIPPKFPSGGKLRIRNKGRTQNNKRGDLILSINIGSNVSPAT
ncbi:MAG: DnaJ domain-containing protein [Nitrospinae bacterium]|nr:DnaJ domain-containing protein [Nitrospinota bacterium]MZH15351.1 DnaJ domain-containing protein [Nitrospinota bacterium]